MNGCKAQGSMLEMFFFFSRFPDGAVFRIAGLNPSALAQVISYLAHAMNFTWVQSVHIITIHSHMKMSLANCSFSFLHDRYVVHARYEYTNNGKDHFGHLLPNGSWSGLMGTVLRKVMFLVIKYIKYFLWWYIQRRTSQNQRVSGSWCSCREYCNDFSKIRICILLLCT